MRKKYLVILLSLLLCCMAALAACTPDGGGGGGGGDDTKLAKVTGFSYDNTGYWKWNEVSGAEQYTVMIDISPIYYLTVQQSDVGANGKFTVGTGSIPVGNHTAMIVARAEGKTDSDAATCTANVSSAGETITLTITNANYDNATKTLSWDKVTNATGYTAALRRQGTGQYITIPQAQVSEGEGYEGQPIMKAVVNYDLVKQAFTVAGEGNDLSGPVEFKITAQGSTQGLTTYADGEHIFTKTYAITKLATPSVQHEEAGNWYTRTVYFNKIDNATGYEITVGGQTLEEAGVTLTDTGTRMEFEWSEPDYEPRPGGISVKVKAISVTNGIKNVLNVESDFGNTALDYLRPADAATYGDVVEALAPKMTKAIYGITAINGLIGELKGFDLNTGNVYFECEYESETYFLSGNIRNWNTLNPQKYEDIINHLSNSNNNIQNAKVESDKTWESILAELGDDYWGGENLYAYKVIDILMPKIITATQSLFDSNVVNTNTIILKAFNLTDGKVYWEVYNSYAEITMVISGTVGRWTEQSFSNYDDISNYLSLQNTTIQGSAHHSYDTWETVRAGLTDYYSIWNLSGYLAAQA